jgi:DNA-binding winged helix-turn-helix (wHTH) protein
LLVYLLRHAGKALTREDILSSVWGKETVVEGPTVDNFISNLRNRFEIRSVRGVGYRMDLPQGGHASQAQTSASRPGAPPTRGSRSCFRRRRARMSRVPTVAWGMPSFWEISR